MEKLKSERMVIPSMELLSEMESLEIYGGMGANDATYGYCNVLYCNNCGCIEPPKFKSCTTNATC